MPLMYAVYEKGKSCETVDVPLAISDKDRASLIADEYDNYGEILTEVKRVSVGIAPVGRNVKD